jgi:hypothetical protein
MRVDAMENLAFEEWKGRGRKGRWYGMGHVWMVDVSWWMLDSGFWMKDSLVG